MIKALVEEGIYQKDIAKKLGVHPKTMSRAVQRESAPGRSRKKQVSKLEAYNSTIDRLLSEVVWNGVVVLRELLAEMYGMGCSRLVKLLRVLGPEEGRLETWLRKQIEEACKEVVAEGGGAGRAPGGGVGRVGGHPQGAPLREDGGWALFGLWMSLSYN